MRSRERTFQAAVGLHATTWGERGNGELLGEPGRWGLSLEESGLHAAAREQRNEHSGANRSERRETMAVTPVSRPPTWGLCFLILK